MAYKESYVYKVTNKNRDGKENAVYYFIRYKSINFLFTKHDMDRAIVRAHRNPEDIPKKHQFTSDADSRKSLFMFGTICGLAIALLTGVIGLLLQSLLG